MRRVFSAFIFATAFVGAIEVVARKIGLFHYLLIGGLLAGLFAEDAGWRAEGDPVPWGPMSTSIEWAVNVAIYSFLASLMLAAFAARQRLDANN